MTDLLEQAKQRYLAGVPDGNPEAAAFRADVGYLLARLSDVENRMMDAHAASKSNAQE